jgi:hypothetical protein
MFDKLQDIIGVLLILGLLLSLQRILSPQKPPTKRPRTPSVPRASTKSRTD